MAMKARFISFVWGWAEAVFFFIVPDVWLSRIVLTKPREAWIHVLLAASGALIGGAMIYAAGAAFFEQSKSLMTAIPAISVSMVEQAGSSLETSGPIAAMMTGALSGIPFKIYALWAGHSGISLPAFLLAALAARLARFTLVTGLTYGTAVILRRYLPLSALLIVHAVLWTAFYGFYFWWMGL